MSSVPRAQTITGRQSNEERANDREWWQARQQLKADRERWGYGSPEGKAAWLARVRRTRSV